MRVPWRAGTALLAVVVVVLAAAPAADASRANVAALQVALRALHLYHGAIDGIAGRGTRRALRRFQRRKRLVVDGVAGPMTRRALGRRGRPRFGSRTMKQGQRGWDVAALQFLLRRRGAAPGSIDGGFGPATRAAVMRFQRARGLTVDGVAGPATQRAVQRRARRRTVRSVGYYPGGPVRFFRPVSGLLSSGFGLRWGRMHTGLDFAAPYGARVSAAGVGVTSFAGWNSGGYGYLVIISHRLGYQSWYAHLSRVTTSPGERVVGGTRIGYVGSTGHSTGPHLHFEVRRYGSPINPLSMLLSVTAARASSRPERSCSPKEPPFRGPPRGDRRWSVC